MNILLALGHVRYCSFSLEMAFVPHKTLDLQMQAEIVLHRCHEFNLTLFFMFGDYYRHHLRLSSECS